MKFVALFEADAINLARVTGSLARGSLLFATTLRGALRSMLVITRSMIVARSNSANTPSIWTIQRPACTHVALAHACPSLTGSEDGFVGGFLWSTLDNSQ
jgi:hypothetical protein